MQNVGTKERRRETTDEGPFADGLARKACRNLEGGEEKREGGKAGSIIGFVLKALAGKKKLERKRGRRQV